MKYPFIETEHDLIPRIELFNDSIGMLQDRLSNNIAWYAYNREGKWRFGPSKFIGYQSLSAHDYLNNSHKLSGSDTEKALKAIGVPVQENSPLFLDLRSQLTELLNKYEKRPNVGIRFKIVKAAPDLQSQDETKDLLELLTRIAYTLPASARKELRDRLK